MKNFTAFVTLLAFVTSGFVARADTNERVSSLADRESVNLTVYNSDLSLVHDRRHVILNDGLNTIAWRDVSAQIDATSAILDARDGKPVSVFEQNFNYDVLDPDSLLRNYVGHDVTVIHPANDGVARRERARVLSVDNGIVLQYADRIETGVDGRIIFPSIPSSLRDRPTLTLDIDSPVGATRDLDLSYLTGGLSWHANYIGSVHGDGRSMDLLGLVTLDNQSGTSFNDARLQLIAGDVHAPPPPSNMLVKAGTTSDEYGAPAPAQSEDIGEYHLYTMPRPTTILNKQTKQIAFVQAHDVPIAQMLEVGGQGAERQQPGDVAGETHLPVRYIVSFKNKGGDLGIPLPGGQMRIYENDSQGLSQFAGSDAIDHTARNADVKLLIGNAFDVNAQTRDTKWHMVSNCETKTTRSLHLTNGKLRVAHVQVNVPLEGEWSIIDENARHTMPTSQTARWELDIPADGSRDLNYTVDTIWCR